MTAFPDQVDRSQSSRTVNALLALSVVLFAVAGVNWLRTAWELPGERCLLIHADDAGLSAAVNRGTIAAMERGLVTSASVMVPCAGFDEFALYAAAHPEKDFGVHLTLTSEWDDVRWGPVADPADVPSLVDGDGRFWPTADDFARHAQVDEVETEIRAQIQWARDRGFVITHLDNHMNSLFRRPDLLEVLVRVSIDEGLPIRYAKRLPTGWDEELSAEIVEAYFAQLKRLYEHHNPLADRIVAENYQIPADHRRSYLLERLRQLEPGVTELVVHCCEHPTSEWSPPDAAGRSAETAALLSPELTSEVKRLGIRLIDWQRLRESSQDTQRPHW